MQRGMRIGAYDVIAKLGEGGMGEVYHARDTTLDRDVALKILSDSVAADPDRLKRFEREAKALASLNHPHIAQIYSVEEASPNEGAGAGRNRVLVMELVAGEDLSERIARGPVPLEEALPIARQIAEALEAAHEAGVIHRDLKPANVKMRPDGTVKVLDFGLAKVGLPAVAPPGAKAGGDEVLNSPTFTSPAVTMQGVILGTAAYMAPEQARGLPVDKRADIWAFGCVFYELLTGVRPFGGDTVTDLIAAVVKSEPDWSKLPPDVPHDIRALIVRCLAKDPRRRLRDLGDALPHLDPTRRHATSVPLSLEPGAGSLESGAGSLGTRAERGARWTLAAATSAALIGGFALGATWSSSPAAVGGGVVAHLDVMLPAGHELFTVSGSPLAISPDGTRLAFVAVGGGARQVFLRPLDVADAVPLPNTDAVTHVFFSPDGATLGLVSRDRTLKRLSLADELISDIGSLTMAGFNRPVWTGDGHIVYTLKSLWRIPVAGTDAAALTTLDSARHESLHTPTATLADGTVLFTNWDVQGQSRIEAVRPTDGQRVVVVDRASSGVISPTGHLVFVRNGAVLAAPFDAARLALSGEAVQVIPRDTVRYSAAQPVLALAQNGTLAYAAATSGLARLVRVSTTGAVTPISETIRHYGHPRVSPDGQRIVVEDSGESLWIHDLSRDARTPITVGQIPGASFPIWTRDGRRIVYRRFDEMRSLDAGGGGDERPIPGSSTGDIPVAIAPDGDTLAVLRSVGGGDIYAISLSGAWPARPLVTSPGFDGGADFSPDGRWMVYASTDSGPSQVYLTPFPQADRKWSVSTRGGTQPRFGRSGRQILYRDEARLMAVEVEFTGDDVRLSQPRLLFTSPFAAGALVAVANYDVTPDGGFVMMQTEPTSPRIAVILNWTSVLQRALAATPGR